MPYIFWNLQSIKFGKFESPKIFWSWDISIFLKSEKGLELVFNSLTISEIL